MGKSKTTVEAGNYNNTLKLSFKKNLGVNKGGRRKKWKNHKQIIQLENYSQLPVDTPTYVSIKAPVSLIPPKKYCDITGLLAKYTEPKTRIRYHNSALYHTIQLFSAEQVSQLLALRKADFTI